MVVCGTCVGRGCSHESPVNNLNSLYSCNKAHILTYQAHVRDKQFAVLLFSAFHYSAPAMPFYLLSFPLGLSHLYITPSFSRLIISLAAPVPPPDPSSLSLDYILPYISPVHPLQLQAVGGGAPTGGRRAGRRHRRLLPRPGWWRRLRLVSTSTACPLITAAVVAACPLVFAFGTFGRGRAATSALRSPPEGLRGKMDTAKQVD